MAAVGSKEGTGSERYWRVLQGTLLATAPASGSTSSGPVSPKKRLRAVSFHPSERSSWQGSLENRSQRSTQATIFPLRSPTLGKKTPTTAAELTHHVFPLLCAFLHTEIGLGESPTRPGQATRSIG